MSAEAPSNYHPDDAVRDPLMTPITIGKIRFRNRIISISHSSMLDEGGMPTERYQRYHEEKARGGLAMTMIGGIGHDIA